MKIIDGLKLDGWQVEIPGCGRDDFPEFFRDMGYKVGAEIGIRKGGVIAGHDYTMRGGSGLYDVKFIVDAYTRCLQIPKWYVLGKEKEVDKYRSLFWIK